MGRLGRCQQSSNSTKQMQNEAMHTKPSISRFDLRRVNCSGSLNPGVGHAARNFNVRHDQKYCHSYPVTHAGRDYVMHTFGAAKRYLHN